MLRVDINLLFTVINLLLLTVAFRIFLFKPVKKIIEKRQEEVDAEYNEAKKKQEEADALMKQCEEDTAALEATKEKVLKDAKNDAMTEYKRIISEAEITAKEIKEEAKVQAAGTKENLLKKTEQEYAELVIDAAKKVVGSQYGEELDRSLYDEFLTKVGEKS